VISLRINGQVHELDVDPEMPLLWAIRDVVGLTGTKYGCGKALCGACTVHIDGQPARSCSIAAASVVDRDITTIMAATALLERIADPDDQDIDLALQGNICRCATYFRIRKAIKAAANNLRAEMSDA
jgi:isoquinoline 1-oxidoreductase alpha subunit